MLGKKVKSRVKMKKTSIIDEFRGIENIGNTCYANCILQILIRNPFINKSIKMKKLDKKNNVTNIVSLIIKYKQYSSKLNNLTRALLKKLYYDIGECYDVGIFYRDLVNKIISDSNMMISTICKSTFTGEYSNIFECLNCGDVDQTTEIFLDKTVLLNEDIITLFDDYTEIIEDSYCLSCKITTKLKLTKKISRIPNTIVISCNYNKSFTPRYDVLFNNYKYSLQALIIYDPIEKHFTAQIITSTKDSYILDDSLLIETTSISNKNIVMLVYNKIE